MDKYEDLLERAIDQLPPEVFEHKRFKIYNERILDLVDLAIEKQTRVMSITLANLITLDIHKENAMKNLLVKGVKRINEFDWIMNFEISSLVCNHRITYGM